MKLSSIQFQIAIVFVVLIQFTLCDIGCGAAFASSLQGPQSADPVDASNNDCRSTLIKAARSAEAAITSGQGKGVYHQYTDTNGTRSFEQIADVDFSFDGDRYYLSLTYQKNHSSRTRHVIIYDGEVVAASFFSPKMHPVGADAVIRVIDPASDGAVKPITVGFEFDITKTGRLVLYTAGILQGQFKDEWHCQFTEADDIQLNFNGPEKNDVTFKKSFGYLPSQIVHNHPEVGIYQRQTSEWKQFNGLWWPSMISYWRRLEEDIIYRELVITEFTPNVPIPEELFTIDALDLPPGARIVDKSNDERANFHYIPATDDQIKNAAVGLVQAATELPTRKTFVPKPEALELIDQAKDDSSRFNFWIIANIVVLIAIGMIIAFRRR